MICTVDNFDYSWFQDIPILKRNKGNQSSTQKYYYKDIVTAFDIETTYIKEIDNSVMYIWQWQFGDKCTVIGRTWYELREFFENLKEILEDNRLVIFVHNLSFEFQYLSGIFPFAPEDVFCMESRKILKALYNKSFEFRCSYLQTNMSLRTFCEKMGVKSYKLKLNYKKRRYWYTELSPKEIAYCINDVKGLVEAITIEMERDKDNLYTLPLTSTGYARRDAKKAMRKTSPSYIKNQLPEYEVYKLINEAFRGGNTHASRYYAGKILEDLESEDIKSSYPNEILNSEVPVSKFTILKDCTLDKLHDLIYTKHKACLIRCAMFNVTLKDDIIPVPYLPLSKCRAVYNYTLDNGRILDAEMIGEVTMTDIDYKIFCKQYDADIRLITVATARYGKLPQQLRNVVLDYFKTKTLLDGKETDSEHTKEFYKLLYGKQKNLLNAQYGMMAQNPVKKSIKYVNGKEDLYDPEDTSDEVLLNDHNKRAFLNYAWGCWICSRAREHLQAGIDLVGIYFVYCDTDSVKYIRNDSIDWSKLNDPVKKAAIKNGTYAVNPKGENEYTGLFEREDHIKRFITLGAKKYAYEDDEGKLHITIAGVNKRIGAIELKRAGGLEAMQPGFKFKFAGGLEARYSDYPDIDEWTTEDGVPIRITRNVSLVENTKTLGLAQEYKELLEKFKTFSIDL